MQIIDGEHFGLGENVGRSVGACSVASLRPTYRSNGDVISVVFVSNEAIAGRGFVIEYSLDYGKCAHLML